MMLPFDSYAYVSPMRQIFPSHKMLFAVVMFIVAAVSHPLAQLLLFIWMGWWIVFHAGVPLKAYVRMLTLPLAFLVMSIPPLCLMVVPVSISTLPTHDWLAGMQAGSWYIYLSHTGMQKAGVIAVRSAASVAVLYFLLFTVPFAEVLQVMRQWRVPALVLDLLLIMYRFLFVLFDISRQLKIAQQSRGGGQGSFSRLAKDAAMLVVSLFSRTWQRYRQIMIGLEARGYIGDLRVLSFNSYRRSSRLAVEAVLGSAVIIGVDWFLWS